MEGHTFQHPVTKHTQQQTSIAIMKKTMKFFLLPVLALVAVFFACNKSDSATTEEAIDEVLYYAQERGGIGRFGCYELVFPVTITLPDSTTATVASYDELKQTLRNYFESNGLPGGNGHHHGNRPRINFVFPFDVIAQDGAVITVDDAAELKQLREDCGGTFGNHGHHGHGNHGLSCFEIVFPITLQFPDSTTVSVADRQAMRQAVRTWHQNNPGASGRPQIVFPITVILTDDQSQVVVESREALHDLKESCE
jgi:hypothetical protein